MVRPTKSTLTTEELIKLYETGLSLKELGRLAGISDRSVAERFERVCYERRDVATSRERHVQMTEPLIELIDGLMLGDGSISARSPRLVLNQNSEREGWVRQVKAEMEAEGLSTRWTTSPGGPGAGPDGREIMRGPKVHLNSHAFVELRKQRTRWYLDSTKRVPHDVRLTSRVLAHWLCGDGSIAAAGRFGKIKLSTESFTHQEVAGLAEKLRTLYELDVRVHQKRIAEDGTPQYVIYVGKDDDVLTFAQIVRPHIPECCLYKLPIVAR